MMITINLIAFGKINEIVTAHQLELPETAIVNDLKIHLENMFPLLKGMSYQIAVNKKFANQNEKLEDTCEVALMPPFSGG